MSELDLETVRHALRIARDRGFAEVEISLGSDAFSARLSSRGAAAAPAAIDAAAPEEDEAPGLVPIRSTLVGYYQEGDVPLRIGTTIAKGDVVAVIAALGLANDIDSTIDGEIVEVLVEPDQPVEYGQPLAMVRSL